MSKSYAVAVLATIGLIGSPGTICQAQTPPDNGSTNVILRAQQTNMWCWAASGQMVMEFLGKNVSQCDEADKRFSHNDCCNSPTPAPCIQGGWPEFDKYGFAFQTTSDTALSWDELRAEIATHNRPFAFSWHWIGGGGHMMVVRGFLTVDGKRFVSINDPWPPNIGDQRDITYEEFIEGPDHTHWNDYYAVTAAVVAPGNAPGAAEPKQVEKKAMRPGQGTDPKEAVAQTREIAERSLETYRKLVIRKEGPGAAVGDLRLGDPFPVAWIGLDELQNFPGGDPSRVFRKGVDKVLYPIQSANEIRSSVMIQKRNDKWVDDAYGNKALTMTLAQSRDRFTKQFGKPVSEFYAVSIPALNMYFLATATDGDTTLISVIDHPEIGIKAGVPEKATELMPRLREAARNHNGLPR